MSAPPPIAPPSSQPESSPARRIALAAAALAFVLVFGFVVFLGDDRLRGNPKDVLGTAALFAALAALLVGHVAWRVARRR